MDYYKLTHVPPEYSLEAGSAFGLQRRDTVAIPVIWIVLLLSVLLHVAALYFLPPLHLTFRPGDDPDIPLAVELRPRLQPPPGIPERSANAPKPEAVPPPVASAPRMSPSAPPVRPRARPSPEVMTAPAPKPELPVPERAHNPNPGDFASLIESRRRARGESAPPPPERSAAAPALPPDDDLARSNRIVAANLGLGRTPTFGGEPRFSGGIFQVTRLGYSDAEFLFYGWNKEIRRNTSQLIEVRKGQHSDIKLAVIRKMITIVREHETGDFRWDSQRLGRSVTLSARLGDNAGLEDFMMREFFEAPRQ